MRRICKNYCTQIGMSIFILGMFGYLFYILQYLYLPVGDDVLFQFKSSYQLYTNKDMWRPTELISGISEMNEEIWGRWLNFSGRFTTVYFVPLLNIAGQRICAVIGTLIYIGTGIAIGRLCWGSWKQVFIHPIGLMIIYLLQYQLSPSSMYMQMWTFVCHYHFPILLYLLYYIFWESQLKNEMTWKRLLVTNLFGIIVGATHELLPLYLFIIMAIYGIKNFKQEGIFIFIKTNLGLMAGYLFVALAPGNIVRMQIEHDVARTQTGIIEKLGASILPHAVVLGMKSPIVIALLVCALWWIGKRIIIKRLSIKDVLFENLEYLVAGFASVFLWAIVAPPVGLYTLPFFKAILIIWFFRTIKVKMESRRWYPCWAAIIIVVYLITNFGWVKDFYSVATLRKNQVQEAIRNNQEEVIVTRYPDTTYNCLTSYNHANEDGIYETEDQEKYYGLHIIIGEEQ